MADTSYSFLDIHFARFMKKRSGLKKEKAEVFEGIVMEISAALRGGHTCFPLKDKERDLVLSAQCVSEGEETPLVLYKDKLYLQKYFLYEKQLAETLAGLSLKKRRPAVSHEIDDCFARNCDEGEFDWQKKAAQTALEYDLCIISGGPGTGKTSTVVRILGLLLQSNGKNISIALSAPTGKAAMRLKSSIGGSKGSLRFPQEIVDKIPMEAMTIHRLLGVKKDSPFFRHNSENPLSWDVVVVDEASMVDLALMSKLVNALKPGGKLLLLGDKDQLASVESGSVLGDVIKALPENTVQLQKSYRFNTGIKELAGAINSGEAEKTWGLLKGREYPNVSILEEGLEQYMGNQYEEYLQTVQDSTEFNLASIFYTFNKFRVLCGVRHGGRGVHGINSLVEEYFGRRGLDVGGGLWYHGRPVLISKNDYSIGLYNGDIGICLRDPEDQILKVWFEHTESTYRRFLPFRLPPCETAFAMTIHKSQGSEFEEVLVVLPDKDNQVLSRELLYTAVTRAKEEVRVSASKELLHLALHRKVKRYGGLKGKIIDLLPCVEG